MRKRITLCRGKEQKQKPESFSLAGIEIRRSLTEGFEIIVNEYKWWDTAESTLPWESDLASKTTLP